MIDIDNFTNQYHCKVELIKGFWLFFASVVDHPLQNKRLQITTLGLAAEIKFSAKAEI